MQTSCFIFKKIINCNLFANDFLIISVNYFANFGFYFQKFTNYEMIFVKFYKLCILCANYFRTILKTAFYLQIIFVLFTCFIFKNFPFYLLNIIYNNFQYSKIKFKHFRTNFGFRDMLT